MAEDNGKLEELKRKFGNKDNPQDFPQSKQSPSAGDIQLPPPTEFDIDLEKLRGLNRTEDLARLMQTVTHAPDRGVSYYDGPVLQRAIYNLQGWAKKVDGELSVGLTANPPKDAGSLYKETAQLIKEGFVPAQLDFFELCKRPNDRIRFWRQDMWQLIYELFKIDRTGLGLYSDGWAVKSDKLQHDYEAVDRYMLQLVSNQLARDGRKLKEEAVDDHGSRMVIHWGKTVIPGVDAGIGISDRWVLERYRVKGYPKIDEFFLGFDPTFISGVRPLTREQLNTYSKPTPNSPSS